VWHERHAETAEARRRLEARVAELRRREDRLNETFIYRRAIDQATYERQRDRLAEEATLAKVEPHDAQLDELDVEGVLAFAEHLLANVARMWAEAALDQKQRLQRVLFRLGSPTAPTDLEPPKRPWCSSGWTRAQLGKQAKCPKRCPAGTTWYAGSVS